MSSSSEPIRQAGQPSKRDPVPEPAQVSRQVGSGLGQEQGLVPRFAQRPLNDRRCVVAATVRIAERAEPGGPSATRAIERARRVHRARFPRRRSTGRTDACECGSRPRSRMPPVQRGPPGRGTSRFRLEASPDRGRIAPPARSPPPGAGRTAWRRPGRGGCENVPVPRAPRSSIAPTRSRPTLAQRCESRLSSGSESRSRHAPVTKNTLGRPSRRMIGNATSRDRPVPVVEGDQQRAARQSPREHRVEADDLIVARHPANVGLEDVRPACLPRAGRRERRHGQLRWW